MAIHWQLFFCLITTSGPFYLAIHKNLFSTPHTVFNFNYKLLSPYLAPVFNNFTLKLYIKLLKLPLIRINPFQKHFFFCHFIYLINKSTYIGWIGVKRDSIGLTYYNNSNYFFKEGVEKIYLFTSWEIKINIGLFLILYVLCRNVYWHC